MCFDFNFYCVTMHTLYSDGANNAEDDHDDSSADGDAAREISSCE